MSCLVKWQEFHEVYIGVHDSVEGTKKAMSGTKSVSPAHDGTYPNSGPDLLVQKNFKKLFKSSKRSAKSEIDLFFAFLGFLCLLAFSGKTNPNGRNWINHLEDFITKNQR
jgi:hypothetical protein